MGNRTKALNIDSNIADLDEDNLLLSLFAQLTNFFINTDISSDEAIMSLICLCNSYNAANGWPSMTCCLPCDLKH